MEINEWVVKYAVWRPMNYVGKNVVCHVLYAAADLLSMWKIIPGWYLKCCFRDAAVLQQWKIDKMVQGQTSRRKMFVLFCHWEIQVEIPNSDPRPATHPMKMSLCYNTMTLTSKNRSRNWRKWVSLPSGWSPAWTSLRSTAWSTSWCSWDSPCCATSCPPVSCRRRWPASARCRTGRGWTPAGQEGK